MLAFCLTRCSHLLTQSYGVNNYSVLDMQLSRPRILSSANQCALSSVRKLVMAQGQLPTGDGLVGPTCTRGAAVTLCNLLSTSQSWAAEERTATAA